MVSIVHTSRLSGYQVQSMRKPIPNYVKEYLVLTSGTGLQRDSHVVVNAKQIFLTSTT